jgi:hypothetical protein
MPAAIPAPMKKEERPMRSRNDLRHDLGRYLIECGNHPEYWEKGLMAPFRVQPEERPLFEEIVEELVERFGEKWSRAFEAETKQ